MLKIYNSLTRKKEIFEPIHAGKVGMYVCGMTVYDYCHVGHARVMVTFDVVARYLRICDYAVTYVRNITDIDDKIIARANENGETIQALTERFITEMDRDSAALGVERPDQEPRATTSMVEIIAMIEDLVDKGYAYQAANNDVYYRVNRFEKYGQLSGKRLEDLRSGERVDVDKAKEDAFDFVLWKSAKPDEPSWSSPWGEGRPGWHIECSAMATDCLGHHIDIHGGGMDLMFPHHDNEIAQSEASTGHHFVNTWMHNGFVQIDEEKMSKSLGNFFTVREVLKEYKPEVVRFFILNSHYRSPLNYSTQNLDNARTALTGFYQALVDVELGADLEEDKYVMRFKAAMDDDFNTPEALAVLFEIRKAMNVAMTEGDKPLAGRLGATLCHLGGWIGLLQDDPDGFLKTGVVSAVGTAHGSSTVSGAGASTFSDEKIDALIEARLAARTAKDWAEADRIRDELDAAGILLEDRAGEKTRWRRK